MRLSLDQLKDLPGQLKAFRTYYNRLTDREKYIVLSMVAGAALFLMFLVYTTFWGLTVRMATKIETGRKNLAQIGELRQRYISVERQVRQMEGMIRRTPPDFQLLSRLEKLAQKNSVRIDSTKDLPAPSNDLYKETQVAVTVNKISLRTLINFLHDIENADELMRISTLRVKPDYLDPTVLNTNFVVSTFQPVAGL